ncbi:MAG: DUF192 domain-containing protein [Rhodoferax sp.]|nr:DUF192 domain-containing protein [Rhodoferax sp.]MCF8209245.1 DUF192 domain-containing protein [Rhodoferax sp.]
MKFSGYLAAICLSLSFCAVNAQIQAQPQLHLQRTPLSVGIYQIDAQVATTAQEHATGLMFRSEMPQHEGMLFAFPTVSTQCFWMKNTFLPLTAAFVADDGTIVNMEDMKPQSTQSHCSRKPVRFVLEMNQGWFAKKGIKPGSKISGSPFESGKK